MRLVTSVLDRLVESLKTTCHSRRRRARGSVIQRAIVELLEPRMLMSAAPAANLTPVFNFTASSGNTIPVTFTWTNGTPAPSIIGEKLKLVDQTATGTGSIVCVPSTTSSI